MQTEVVKLETTKEKYELFMKKLKPVFHMIAAIAEKKKVQRSHRSNGNHSPCSDPSDNDQVPSQ